MRRVSLVVGLLVVGTCFAGRPDPEGAIRALRAEKNLWHAKANSLQTKVNELEQKVAVLEAKLKAAEEAGTARVLKLLEKRYGPNMAKAIAARDEGRKAFRKRKYIAAARWFSLSATRATEAKEEAFAQECYYCAALTFEAAANAIPALPPGAPWSAERAHKALMREANGNYDTAYHYAVRAGNMKGPYREEARGLADKLRTAAPPMPPGWLGGLMYDSMDRGKPKWKN